jgi:stage III sporulation protein SpoIIIAA
MSNPEDGGTTLRRNVTIYQLTRHKMQILRLLGPECGGTTLLRNVGNYHSLCRDTLRDLNLHVHRRQIVKLHNEFSQYTAITQALLDQKLSFLHLCFTSPLKALEQTQASSVRSEVLTMV